MITVELQFDDDELIREYPFNHVNPNWSPNQEQNLFFLRSQENLSKDLLRMRGVLLLNDVLDNLGFARTVAGAVFGWSMGFYHHSNVEFTIEPVGDLGGSINVRFNVQGVVVDQIESAHQLSVAQYNVTHPHDQ